MSDILCWMSRCTSLVGPLSLTSLIGHPRIASSQGIIGPYHPITHHVLVLALTCVATVGWEFAEFLCDRFFGTHAQLGLADTLGDMLLGICGGTALLVAMPLVSKGPIKR